MPYRIDYSPDAEDHLRSFEAHYRVTILDVIDEQLTHQPTVETRRRKPMRPNQLAPWELRIGDFRVYYDVEEAPEPVVNVRAIGVKERNVVRIAGKVIEL